MSRIPCDAMYCKQRRHGTPSRSSHLSVRTSLAHRVMNIDALLTFFKDDLIATACLMAFTSAWQLATSPCDGDASEGVKGPYNSAPPKAINTLNPAKTLRALHDLS